MTAIFISHSSQDREVSDQVKGSLEDAGYQYIFLDFDKKTGIGAGENWENKLYDELRRCHAVVLVLTPNWIASKWCFVEYAQARALGKIILPIQCEPLGERVLPEIQALDLVDFNDHGFDSLKRRLHTISDELARGFHLPPDREPYPGIHAFEADDAAIFFGRDKETQAILEKLEARRNQGGSRFVVVIGASGSGKSSVLKAGILPQLERRRSHWLALPCFRPEKRPLEALAKAIAERLGSPGKWRELHAALAGPKGIDQLDELLTDLRVGETRAATVLLAIDQFEELFTIAEPDERTVFLDLLTKATDPERRLPLIVIATGRSDVLQGLIESGELGEFCEAVPLIPMPLDRVSRLVEGPASIAGLNVEEGLAAIVARDVESPEALPLLAHALALLYRRCRKQNKLTISEYELLGDKKLNFNPIQNSVRLVADDSIQRFNPDENELDALRDAFIPHLVRIRLDDGRWVRQVARTADLPKESSRLIQALVEARLLSKRGESGGAVKDGDTAVVEVTHEALFKAWPTLNQWLVKEQEFLSDIERLKDAVDIWTSAAPDHKPNALLHGLLLTRAREWKDQYPQRFAGSDMEPLRDLIKLSAEAEDAANARLAAQEGRIQAEEARAKRMQHWLTRGAIAAAIIFGAAALFAGVQYFRAQLARQTAEIERNTALHNQSLFLVDLARQQIDAGDYATAMALALEALPDAQGMSARPYLPAAEAMLYNATMGLRERRVLRGHLAQIRSVEFSPNGRLVGTAGYDSTARIWDASSGQMLVQIRHDDHLEDIAFSPNGERVVTASWDRTARVWETATGNPIAVLHGHGDQVNTAVFSPDGRRVLTASKDGTARIWDAQTGAELFVLRHNGEVHTAIFAPGGGRIVTASADKTAIIWNADTGAALHVLSGHEDAVFSVAYSADAKMVVTASFDRTARTWDAETGERLAVLKGDDGGHDGHDDVVLAAAFSPDGRQIVTASADMTARLWNAKDGSAGPVLRGHHKGVVAVAFSPNGRQVITSSGDSTARIWDTTNGSEIMVLRGHEGWVYSAAWSPDGRQVATASFDATARIWNVNGAAEVTTLRGHDDSVTSVALSADGRLVASGSDDRTARIWDVATGQQIAVLGTHMAPVSAIAFSPDGRKLATASWDNTTRIWDTASGAEIHVLQGHGNRINSVAFSPDGRRLATVSSDQSLRLWDAESGTELAAKVNQHVNLIQMVTFSPDGKGLATASNDSTARIWDGQTGAEGPILKGHTLWVHAVAFSPDSKRVVTGSQDRTARVWDVATGQLLAVMQDHTEQIQSVAFSPDGRYVITASWDNTARIWDAATGAKISVLNGHENHVEAAAFLLDGMRAVTVSTDKTARVWDVMTGAELAVLRGHDDQVRALALLPDGRRVATASDDKTVRIWPVFAKTQDLIDHAKAVIPRTLTNAQRSQFFLETR